MTIAADSRYALGDLINVLLSDGSSNKAVFAGEVTSDPIPVMYYLVVDGDTFTQLAQRFFGDGTKWWVIADMNPQIRWALNLIPGITLLIPQITTTSGTNTAWDTLLSNIETPGITRA